jgi:hypothetical protein
LSPQHATVPSTSSAQVSFPPAAMSVAPVKLGTGSGVDEPDGPPLNPKVFLLPQHSTEPLESSAQVWLQPAAIAVTASELETICGVEESTVVPSPSCPQRL